MCFFFNDTATTEIYTLSLHDALPISFAVPTADAPLEVSDDSAAWIVSVSSLFAARKLAIGGDGKLRGGATATVTIGEATDTVGKGMLSFTAGGAGTAAFSLPVGDGAVDTTVAGQNVTFAVPRGVA